MSNKTKRHSRLLALRQYGHLYRRHLDAGADHCFYCGALRECLDHRPPVTLLHTMTPKAMRDAAVPLALIPACWDCNKRLSDRPLLTAADALFYLTERIEKEYERKVTLWAEDEIRQMSPMFQTIIRARKAMLSDMHARLRYMQERAFDTHLMPVYLPPDEDDDSL